MSTDAYKFALLENTTDTGPKFVLVLTFPDGKAISRECESEADAERVMAETVDLISQWYRRTHGEENVSVREETTYDARESKRTQYMN